ncbi:MAG: penicillin-binding protein 1A, partial [Bradymonadaceae bacterium]
MASSRSDNRGIGGWLISAAKWGFLIGLTGALIGAAGIAGLFYYYGHDLPDLVTRADYDPKQVTKVFDRDGRLIGEFYRPGGRRTVVPLEKIPTHVRKAFMAAEDAAFMQHEGIDYLGMARAFYYAVVHGDRIEGTSTITQQVVKNLVLVPERTIERKLKEIILARRLEDNLSKRDILYMYLNTIYLGHGNYGVEEASRYYFGKSVSELDLDEAAVLAGLPPGPARLSPVDHPEQARERRAYVLKQLWEKGFVSEAEYRRAKKQPIETVAADKRHPYLGRAPYFVREVKKRLIDRYSEEKVYTDGLRVHTTLDVEDQIAAKRAARSGLHSYDQEHEFYRPITHLSEGRIAGYLDDRTEEIDPPLDTSRVYRAVVTEVTDKGAVRAKIGHLPARLVLEPRERILHDDETVADAFQRGDVLEVIPQSPAPKEGKPLKVRFEPGPQTALVSLDPESRRVRALVGGYDFEHEKFNHATQARRQTGSTFKPFVYGAGLESRTITPASIYLDSPAVFQMPGGKKWSPRNSDDSWRGPVRVREGLGASRNVVAVRVLKDVGIDRAQKFARRMGVKSELVDNYTLVMGSSALTLLELTNAQATIAAGGIYADPKFVDRVETTDGAVDHFRTEKKRVLAPEVAYLLTDLMTAVTEGYVDRNGTQRTGTAPVASKLEPTVAGKTGTTS